MSRSVELWEQINALLTQEGILSENEVNSVTPRILAGAISSDDWKVAIENTLLGGGQDAE